LVLIIYFEIKDHFYAIGDKAFEFAIYAAPENSILFSHIFKK
jgi:hypothetical protein